MKLHIVIFLLFSTSLFSWDVSDISLEKGYNIEIFISNLDKPRGLTSDENGNIFAGSKSGKVYKITPDKEVITISKNLNGSIGIDFHNGDLYVSQIDKIIVYRNINNQKVPYRFETVIDKLPDNKWHGWKYIKIGPDNKLYINIGAPCNTCVNEDKRYGTISRVNLDGADFEIYAKGVRNSVGFDWDPLTGDFWFTDNGPDGFGDNLPPDELNRVTNKGDHFGFPYIHGSSTKDPKFYKKKGEIITIKPEYNLPAHVAPLGMEFYKGDILIAEHGSWNRSEKIGYRISRVKIEDEKAVDYSIFAQGWLTGEKHHGRPVDIEVLPDGSIIISDDFNGNLYRVY